MDTKVMCLNCQHVWEEEVAETLLLIACPRCSVVLDLVRVAETKPGLSSQDQALIRFAGGIAIGFLLLKSFGSGKRRR